MHYSALFSKNRIGIETSAEGDKARERHVFQRDFDRILFSSAFRRLQGKTQVFPLPRASAFVHNRLTHSMEVASLGRSLGNMVGHHVVDSYPDLNEEARVFYEFELGSVIAAASLAHDVGNPPFGHSGEAAISSFFQKNGDTLNGIPDHLKTDFTDFEGNANALRILTSGYQHRKQGGIGLTATTLASILKYPCSSTDKRPGQLSRKKYGWFHSETDSAYQVASLSGMAESEDKDLNATAFKRHPFVFITEAADDICYRIIDLEDAHRLGIVSTDDAIDLLKDLIQACGQDMRKLEKVFTTLNENDTNEQVGYMRAKGINALIQACFHEYLEHERQILAGTHEKSLIDTLPAGAADALDEINRISIKDIYNHRSVVEIEIAGYKVLGGLLEEFVPAVLNPKQSGYHKKLLGLMPHQFRPSTTEPYAAIQSAVDFVSGMTDAFALELYRKLRGIQLG